MKKTIKRALKAVGVDRARIAQARMVSERTVLAGLGRRRKHPGGRILCYHSVGQPELGVNDVTPHLFKDQLETALALGHRFVPASRIAEGEGDDLDLAVTFDDAWRSVGNVAAPLLFDLGIPFSIFVVTGWADRQCGPAQDQLLGWDDLARLSEAGAEIGSHSVTHPDFATIPESQMREELFTSHASFERAMGYAPMSFAIPFGQSRNWPRAASLFAAEAGYRFVYAQAELTRPENTTPRTFVTCFDKQFIFRKLLDGVYDNWEEWF